MLIISLPTVKNMSHLSLGTLTSITNLATSLARNMDRLSLDEEHYTRQEEWRRQLPESLGDGLRQGLSRLGISLLGVWGCTDKHRIKITFEAFAILLVRNAGALGSNFCHHPYKYKNLVVLSKSISCPAAHFFFPHTV